VKDCQEATRLAGDNPIGILSRALSLEVDNENHEESLRMTKDALARNPTNLGEPPSSPAVCRVAACTLMRRQTDTHMFIGFYLAENEDTSNEAISHFEFVAKHTPYSPQRALAFHNLACTVS
jgi:hypothetical protein